LFKKRQLYILIARHSDGRIWRVSLPVVFMTVLSILVSLLASGAGALISKYFFNQKTAEPQLEAQVLAAIDALQQDSIQATALLKKLQTQVEQELRTAHDIQQQLKDLQHQKKLLDLNAEEKDALRALLKKQPTVREIFTSIDFWLGRVAPGAFFFIIAMFVTLKLRKRVPSKQELERQILLKQRDQLLKELNKEKST
jgi:hypothetical protein